MLLNWHGFGATSPSSCGTVSVPHGVLNLARFFVPHRGPELARLQCHIPGTVSVPHSRTITRELNPSCTTCKTDVYSYRPSRRPALTYRTTKVTTDRTRGKESK